MPDSLMDLLREIERATYAFLSGLAPSQYNGHLCTATDRNELIATSEKIRQALTLAEQQQAVVDLIGAITLCPDCEGTRTRKRDGVHACCRLGHARGCQCVLCQWIRAGKRWEQKEIGQQAEIERLIAERDEANAMLDWLADDIGIDGIGSVDISDATYASGNPAIETEDGWREEWRKQMRVAIRAAMLNTPAPDHCTPCDDGGVETPATMPDAPHAPTEAEAADLGRPEEQSC